MVHACRAARYLSGRLLARDGTHMTMRIALVAGGLALAAVALWHPVPRPAMQTTAATQTAPNVDQGTRFASTSGQAHHEALDAVVYVAGAVRHPGLYHASPRDRAADEVAKAGGLTSDADSGRVNLAEHVTDGDEVYVPAVGEASTHSSSGHRRSQRRHGRRGHRGATGESPPAPATVDLNLAGVDELATVPGIGAAIAARIVEMRALDGAFGSVDELLDVAGMTQTRLERARPYLHV